MHRGDDRDVVCGDELRQYIGDDGGFWNMDVSINLTESDVPGTWNFPGGRIYVEVLRRRIVN